MNIVLKKDLFIIVKKNTFSYTTKIGGTQFMKYNQDLYLKKHGHDKIYF